MMAVPFAVWLRLSRRMAPERLLVGLAAWFFIADFFLPAYRDSYNDVLILDVVALGVVMAGKIPWAVWPCVVALPIGWLIYAFAPQEAWVINLPTALFTVGAVGFVFGSGMKTKSRQ